MIKFISNSQHKYGILTNQNTLLLSAVRGHPRSPWAHQVGGLSTNQDPFIGLDNVFSYCRKPYSYRVMNSVCHFRGKMVYDNSKPLFMQMQIMSENLPRSWFHSYFYGFVLIMALKPPTQCDFNRKAFMDNVHDRRMTSQLKWSSSGVVVGAQARLTG